MLDPVTFGQVLMQADTHAPDVFVAAARTGSARSEVGVAGLFTNPRVTVGTTLASARFYTSVFVPVPLFGQRGAAIEAAEATLLAARRAVEVVRLDVRLGAMLAWVDVWGSQRQADTAQATEARRQRLLAATEERYNTGTTPRLDVLRARAEAARAHANAIATVALVGAAAARLDVWLGRDAAHGQIAQVRGDPPHPAPLPELSALLSHLDQHPVVRHLLARTQAAQANVALEQRQRWPLVGVEVGTALWSSTDPVNDAHVGLTIDVPFFHNRGAFIARAEAARGAARLDVSVARTRLTAQLVAAHRALQAALLRERAQTAEVLPSAEEAANVALEAYQTGALDITSVLGAEEALATARNDTYQAIAERVRAQATLEHALGRAL